MVIITDMLHSDTIFWTPAWLLFHLFLQSVFSDNNRWGTGAPSSLDLMTPYNFYLWYILKDDSYSYDTCAKGNLQKALLSASPTELWHAINTFVTCDVFLQAEETISKAFFKYSNSATLIAMH